ncbi:hypothetical protein RUM44_011064 [Polyplax serrata]|uniref:Axin n=1 Tax=Polyplax serrata TaxID=468196 RepID=A0ABR1ANY0_POLSC
MSRSIARIGIGDFDENSPRPPVPGEETEPGYYCGSAPAFTTNSSTIRYKYIPRSSSVHSTANLEGNAPLGFEPEGSCAYYGACTPVFEGSRSPPPCVLWAKSLSCLLQDDDGVELFRRYLEREGQAHAEALDFWFACEGLKKQPNKESVAHFIKAIYMKFILSPTLPIREDMRREVMTRIRENVFDKGVFDSVQADIGKRITATTYPNFLKSDIYLNYLQQMPQDFPGSSGSGSGSGSSSSSAGRDVGISGGPCTFLPTLLEDSELEINSDSLPLTRDTLVATQVRRAFELRPKPEAFAGIYLQHGAQINTRVYSSYNPVSRQDSELQSLSSDARTDSDAMSCTDNSVDGMSIGPHKMSKCQQGRQFKAIKESASLNRDTTHLLIPRTLRIKDLSCQLSTEEFAQQLTEKLEAYKRQQEAQEKFNRKLMEIEYEPEKTLADMIREKLQVEEQDSDNQAILDQHVSRVWSDSTPSRSPGLSSPKPKSPDGRRKLVVPPGVPHPYQTKTPYTARYPKKEKDVFSTFSTDSGNIHDFTDASESGRHFPKSKSFPDYPDPQNSVTGYESRNRSSRDGNSRRINSKKPASETTDSGVSVISDTVPCAGKHSTEWLIMRMKETCDRTNSKHRSIKQMCMSALGTHNKHGRKSERSGSLERYPAQQYLPDAIVPSSSSSSSSNRPNTVTQLEEARRRLEQTRIEDDNRGKMNRLRFPPSNKTSAGAVIPDLSFSNQSTLRKSTRRSEPSPPLPRPPEQEYVTVMYSFWDEEVPYRTKVLGTQVTLKQFKDLLPRKGNYRYYFKTECAEVASKMIHEEVFDDNQELPLWEGKLIAQVRPYGCNQ